MNSTSQIVPGYTGHIPSVDKDSGSDFSVGTRTYIPGYMGYIPHVRSENMFGKTYGNLTHIAKTDPQASKNFAYSQGRFNSTAKDTFGNPKNTGFSRYNMKTTLRNPDEISADKKTQISITAREVKSRAYGF